MTSMTRQNQWQMIFDFMYYMHMSYREIMMLDLAQLRFFYSQLKYVKEQEAEIEKLKMEANMAVMGIKSAKRSMGG